MKGIRLYGTIALVGLIGIAAFSLINKREVGDKLSTIPFTQNPLSNYKQSTEIIGEAGKPQTVDIFSGKPVNRGVFTDYEGQRIYFCCDVEQKKFLGNPALYIQKITERGILLDSTPSAVNSEITAPATQTVEIKGEPGKPQSIDIFSGKPIVRSVYTDYEGKRIYFCCGYEKDIFLKDPALYMTKIEERGIILDTTPS